MKKMTFSEYDKLCERLENNPYQCDGWWPTPEELKENMGSEVSQNIDFLTWILETNPDPETEEEKRSRNYINKLLRNNLKLIDDEEKIR